MNPTPTQTPNALDISSPGVRSNAPTETELAARAVAPRVTQADVDAAIRNTYYHVFPDTMLTVCCITLQNGFTVTGEAACVSPANFAKDIGERIARENATQKIWALLGYALRDRLNPTPKPIDTGPVVIVPTVGRVVWFYPAAGDPFCTRYDPLQPFAATVAYVHDERLINVSVVDHAGLPHSYPAVQLVQEGDAFNPDGARATWMPYQPGQARRNA